MAGCVDICIHAANIRVAAVIGARIVVVANQGSAGAGTIKAPIIACASISVIALGSIYHWNACTLSQLGITDSAVALIGQIVANDLCSQAGAVYTAVDCGAEVAGTKD